MTTQPSLTLNNGVQIPALGFGTFRVDELRLAVFPVVLGEGKRLFGDGAIPRTWRLAAQTTTPTGVLLLTYQRVGEVQTGAIGPEFE